MTRLDTIQDVTTRHAAITAEILTRWQGAPTKQVAYYTFPADDPHTFEPTPGFPYYCARCKSERGLSPELCAAPRQYRRAFYPTLAGATVTAWTGETMGRITSARVFAHNFGGRMVALKVVSTNGATYAGRASWDNGNVITLTKCKR